MIAHKKGSSKIDVLIVKGLMGLMGLILMGLMGHM